MVDREKKQGEGLLKGLEFNAVHCSDVGVRVYFEQAAKAIRKLQWDADFYRRQAASFKAQLFVMNSQAKDLERRLSQAIETQSAEPEGLGPKDESAVAESDAPELNHTQADTP